jgi:DNA adenine methylase
MSNNRHVTETPPPLKPILKWAGGKRWLVPHVVPLWRGHEHRRLVEPMSGGIAIALALAPKRALLNDANPHAINFYTWVQDGLKIRIRMLNDAEFYYRQRARFNKLATNGGKDDKKAAELFYYLNRTCYNGLCRFNSRGEFNVPFGRYTNITYHRDFAAHEERFKRWRFTTGDFESVKLKPDDFVYADPPYDVQFTQYAQAPFSWDDQKRLAKWLSKHPGPVVLSNQATPRIVQLYEDFGFSTEEVSAPRMIDAAGDRTRATEVLATRNL